MSEPNKQNKFLLNRKFLLSLRSELIEFGDEPIAKEANIWDAVKPKLKTKGERGHSIISITTDEIL